MTNIFTKRPTIHIINKFARETGGSEQRAIRLAEILKPYANVKVWATNDPDPKLREHTKIVTIEPRRLQFPVFGTFIVVGVYPYIGPWAKLAWPSRRIIIFNTENPDEFWKMVKHISPWRGIQGCDVVYSDHSLEKLTGIPGTVETSPIDLKRFYPRNRSNTEVTQFTVGRLSRDYRYKFHEDDPALFRRLGEIGIRVRILGGTSLAPELAGATNVELLPVGAEPAPDFLNSLDCLVYRTSSTWFETFGRVVFEAMACGLPIVCGPIGGFARYVRNDENGYVFQDNDEAVRLLTRLRDEADLRRRLGKKARILIEQMYSAEYEKRIVEFYLRGPLNKSRRPSGRAYDENATGRDKKNSE